MTITVAPRGGGTIDTHLPLEKSTAQPTFLNFSAQSRKSTESDESGQEGKGKAVCGFAGSGGVAGFAKE
ncbi:MAG TPA: hypothetical protein VKA46_15240 [Gemmataceae bacterium]|nr:hypothetical protein [Gemmataceae bacterium]